MIDVNKILGVADEIDAAAHEAMDDFAKADAKDHIGAAYSAGAYDAIDMAWAKQLRTACIHDGEPGTLADMLDMASFKMTRRSIRVSDMLSALVQAVKVGTEDAMHEFEVKWLA